jgi:hypothetical protein
VQHFVSREKKVPVRNRRSVYIALALASLAAIMSVMHPAISFVRVRFLLLTSAPDRGSSHSIDRRRGR